jgi:hypothetical protein
MPGVDLTPILIAIKKLEWWSTGLMGNFKAFHKDEEQGNRLNFLDLYYIIWFKNL